MAHIRLLCLSIVTSAVLAGCAKHPPGAVAANSAESGKAARETGAVADGAAGGRKKGDGARTPEAGGKTGGKGSREGKGGGGGRGSGGIAQAVEVINVQRRDLSDTLNVVGSLAPNETATIKPEISGLIRSINFEEGQPVKKGDLLVKLDDSELRAQLAQTQARHQLAKLNLERAENLRQSQSTTQADVDRSRSEYAAAQAELSLLRVRLERTELKAPFDGVTGSRTVSVGDTVNPSTTITELSDLTRLKVEFQVPERFISKVRPGTRFAVKSATLEMTKSVEGEVYFVNSVTDRNTRSTEVKGYLAQPPAALKPGMFATIELILEVRQNALTVPEGAILVDQRGPQVVLVRDQGGDKVAAFLPVRLGMRTRGLVEVSPIQGDLSEKDIVVGAGVGSLQLFQGGRLDPRPLRAEFRVND